MADTQPKPFVFVLMPFDKSFDDIYQLGIKAACLDTGAYSERVDEQQYDGGFLERVYNQISKADLLVADMTGKNPNVFYEVGYAHALGRRVILLTQRTEDIPSDLKHLPHIIYGNSITGLKEQLRPKVKWAIENPQAKSQVFEQTLECRIGDIPIVDNPEIKPEVGHGNSFGISVFIHNSPTRSIETVAFKAGVLLSFQTILLNLSKWKIGTSDLPHKSFSIEDRCYLHLINDWSELLPGEWASFYVLGATIPKLDPTGQCQIRLLTHAGCINFPFRLLAGDPPSKAK